MKKNRRKMEGQTRRGSTRTMERRAPCGAHDEIAVIMYKTVISRIFALIDEGISQKQQKDFRVRRQRKSAHRLLFRRLRETQMVEGLSLDDFRRLKLLRCGHCWHSR